MSPMNNYDTIFRHMGEKAKVASQVLIQLDEATKNKALCKIAELLESNSTLILGANERDLADAVTNGVSTVMMDRLRLTEDRISQMALGVRQLVDLPDPVGTVLEIIDRPNGLRIEKRSVPLGVIGIIFEARPNVTVDASALCFKTGNATILRGGKEAFQTNQVIISIVRQALEEENINPDAVQLVEILDREAVHSLLQQRAFIDVVIPRGGAGLINRVVRESAIPVIETGSGICHTFVDESANLGDALAIAINAKVQRPSVCNSMETLLVHEKIASIFLPMLEEAMKDYHVRIHGDETIQATISDAISLTDESYDTEYNDLDLNVKVVDSVEAAITHINRHNTHHSECIITENDHNAVKFMNEVDAAAVYRNASTRFTDGFEFGFGAEIGISTQKLHARGPMGLRALTSYKYFVFGDGQIRK